MTDGINLKMGRSTPAIKEEITEALPRARWSLQGEPPT